jgi:OOP family OmpA-OmpF porin
MRPRFAGLLLLALGMSWQSHGHAQEAPIVPSLDLRGLEPPTDPNGGLYFEPSSSPDTGDWNIGMWNNYTYRPVTLRNPATDDVENEVIAHQYGGDFQFNIGFFERFSVGIDIPYVLYQTGDDPTADTLAVIGDYTLPDQALGDAKFNFKLTIVKPTNDEFGGFALAFHERLGVPTGEEASFLGEGAVTSNSRVLAEYRYLAVSVHAAAGVKLRAEEEPFGCGALAPNQECATTFGHELPWGLSFVFRPQAIGLDSTGNAAWFVEAFGYMPLSPESPFSSAALSQVQVAAGARVAFMNDISFVAAVDAALLGGVGTPPFRGHLAIQWAPRSHDMDDDGVRDEVDVCPEDLKEDFDGFEDEDGCPDFDNDDDGVLDADDQCEGEREDEDEFQDEDGCIDPDNDGDGVLDDDDHCPMVVGIKSDDPIQRGCPDLDPDKDGLKGDADKCPEDAEDIDKFEDEDGCPDKDNDDDGFEDSADACPDLKGVSYPEHSEDDGCPDKDADAITDGKDACPDVKGVANEDAAKHGCAEEDKDGA